MIETAQPSGVWKFDAAVVANFDEMATRSIPLYKQTIDLAAEFAAYHPGQVADLGCATGAIARRIGGPVVCVDESIEMLDACQASNPDAICVQADLRRGLPEQCASACFFTCLWTAQFVPIEHRQRMFAEIATICRANSGGLFIAEKLRGQTARFQSVLVEQYHNWKHTQGYSVEQIARKAKSLEGALVSFDAPGIKQCLTAEGFKVEEVIRYLGFAAWYCYT